MAVSAFLQGRIGFLDIPARVEEALAAAEGAPAASLDDLLAADADTRRRMAASLPASGHSDARSTPMRMPTETPQ